MNKKKLIILISIIITLAALICVGIFAMSGNKESKIADKLDLGERYLAELEYEKALAVYKEILEVDPKSVDAYLGMAEVYIAMGEYEEALKILEEGYRETNDTKLTAKKSEVEGLINGAQEIPVPTPEATSEPTSEPTPESTSKPSTEGPNVYVGDELTDKEELSIIESKYSDDLVIDWKEERIKKVMQNLTGIYDREIVYGDVKYITGVELASKELKDISALKYLTNLQYLGLDTNQISDISALSELDNLRELRISYNQISDISALSDLSNLTSLSLYGNQISDISALDELKNLEILALGYNQVSDISALSKLTNLEVLDLSDNQISDISGLHTLTNLQHLWLENNPIIDYSMVSFVPDLSY